MTRPSGATRRALVRASLYAPAIFIAGRSGLLAAAQEKKAPDGEQGVSTVEDLMREHGVLRRVLLVYGEASRRLERNADLPAAALAQAAALVRRFVEAYHEKLEEDYLFPRFRKASRLTDLVSVLEEQHKRGRSVTSEIEKLASAPQMPAADRTRLRQLMLAFIRMYEPHAAREDTVLFPAFKTLVSPKEYDALGDEFEKKEQELFGKDGFETSVEEVAGIEKQMQIYDLAQFTPRV